MSDTLNALTAGIGRWIWIDLFDKMSHALEMKQKSSPGDKGDVSVSNIALKRMHSMQVCCLLQNEQTQYTASAQYPTSDPLSICN